MWHFGNKQGEKGTVTSLPLECEPDRGGGDLRCKLSVIVLILHLLCNWSLGWTKMDAN